MVLVKGKYDIIEKLIYKKKSKNKKNKNTKKEKEKEIE